MKDLDIYANWDPEKLFRLKEVYQHAEKGVERDAWFEFSNYQNIPLQRISEKHELDFDKLFAFADWLGAGIGVSTERRDVLPRLLKESEILTVELVREFTKNDELLLDLMEFAGKTLQHNPEQNDHLARFLNADRKVKVNTARLFINQVLDSLQ